MLLPARRDQFSNFAGRMGADTVKHITKIFKGINLTQLAAGNQAIDDSRSFSTSITSGEEPVFASNGNDPQDTLGKIVVDVEAAILNIMSQSFPLSTSITNI